MPSVQCFRQFLNERLTAAAEEIFTLFEKTVAEYEEEIIRQRKVLEIVLKPELNVLKIELENPHVCKEKEDEDEEEEDEALTDQQFQERSSSLDREDSEPPQIKEEPEELCASADREALTLKQETDTFTLSFSYKDGDRSEDQTLCLNEDKAQSAAKKESVDSVLAKSSEVPKADADQRLLPHSSHSAESQGLAQGKREDSEPTTKKKTKPQKKNHTNKIQSTKALKTATSKKTCNAQTGQKSLKCDTCGKAFPCNSKLIRHLMIHTGVKPYSCNICGKNFTQKSALNIHKRIHTGEKPYSCNFCGYRFRDTSTFKRHLKRHTTEKPYQQLCNQERTFSRSQAGPQPLQIKEEEEEEELCAGQDRDSLH
ncbi:zinc finger and SCAN domain-containing protein 12-like [Mugil cephalus]|uniref:zinc finger and SCAN domain-containing protein 12-like n=1 Tax=Mugil cephalus TaxID=48193 RepID=UPI001FB836CD|nr:zinc finger and SCAN domain-containing protein 12-like [Mugil cephalus]